MTLKSITLHRAACDNLGLFVDAGTDLVVGDQMEAGVIDADYARDIVDSHGGIGHYAKPPVDKTKAPTKAKAQPKPISAATAPPPADVVTAPDKAA